MTDYLEKAAVRLPGKVAIVDEVRQMTYGQLLQDARRIGGVLASRVGEKLPVALWLGREGRSIAASQGVAMAGLAYVPLDISMPRKRLRKIFALLQPDFIIADQANSEAAKGFAASLEKVPEVLIYEEMTAGELPEAGRAALGRAMAQRSADDALSIIFTSGSTGTPKGVVSSHRMLAAYTDWQVEALGMDEQMVRASQSPLYFAIGAYSDVYATLAAGGTLHLLPASAFMFPRDLMKRLAGLGINTIFWVPSLFRQIAEMGGLAGELPPLETAYFCGEPMPMGALAAWRQAFPKCSFSNHYGSTELAIAAWYPIGAGEELDYLPIGQPCRGKNEIRLLDEQGSEVPTGEVGEMVVFGPVASEYFGDEERTREAFGVDAEGKRYFHTGDLARRDEAGVLTYVSRSDAQVKHMGYRIELGEIETAADAVEGLSASVCLFDKEKDTLVLFYVAAETLTEKALLSELTDSLPRYMWPARLERLSAMPQKQGGKIDRQALKEML
ncbi:AMP-binding protein [Selenomonas sp. KH1T6]|uniref:AMP-binding protein n=1 Tax=Selenomonas sp. KH1T6 TaxID=3158784 RepID=UPI00296FC350